MFALGSWHNAETILRIKDDKKHINSNNYMLDIFLVDPQYLVGKKKRAVTRTTLSSEARVGIEPTYTRMLIYVT